jgi:hypothetical protein
MSSFATQPLVSPATVDGLIETGGSAALRSYIANRLAVADAAEPGTAKEWSGFALTHLIARAGDQADQGVEVSCASLQMALAYIEWLETTAANRSGEAA